MKRNMIKESDILSLNYYNYGQPFSGSCQGMRYRLIKREQEQQEDGTVIPPVLHVTVWPEPFSFENTDRALMKEKDFEFSGEGKEAAVAWLNDMYGQGGWPESMTYSQLKKIRKDKDAV